MSARGHKPRTDPTKDIGKVVGSVVGCTPVGVGDYTLQVSRDTADIALFNLQIEEWLEVARARNLPEAYRQLVELREAGR